MKLWTPEKTAACLGEIIPLTDILFSGQGDAEWVFGLTGEPEAVPASGSRRWSSPWGSATRSRRAGY